MQPLLAFTIETPAPMTHTQTHTQASIVLLGAWQGALDALVSATMAAWPGAELTVFECMPSAANPTTQKLLEAAAAAAGHARLSQPMEFPQVGCSSNTGLLFKLPPSTPEQVHGLIAALFEAAGRCAPAFSSSRGDL